MDRIAQEAHFRQRVMEYFARTHRGTETANRYHLSRKTLYKWWKRWDGTWQSLCDRSRAAHTHPRAITEAEKRLVRRLAKKHHWTDIILAYQEARDRYGYKRSYASFKQTVRKLKEAKGCKKRKVRKNKPYERAPYPGYKVQVDVKFVPRECSVDGKAYYVFIAVDECSRWTLREMYEEHSSYSAMLFLRLLLEKAPFPIRMIQTDNGTEFTKALLTKDPAAKTLFEEELEKYGIEYHRIRVATPRHNGKVERQNRIDQERFYDFLRFYNLTDGRRQLAVYQRKSNDYIKHCLNLRSPNQVLADYLAVGL